MLLRACARVLLTLQRGMRIISWGLLFLAIYVAWSGLPLVGWVSHPVNWFLREVIGIGSIQDAGQFLKVIFGLIILGVYVAVVIWIGHLIVNYVNAVLPRRWQLSLDRSRTPTWMLRYYPEAGVSFDYRWKGGGWRRWFIIALWFAFLYWMSTVPPDPSGVKEGPW